MSEPPRQETITSEGGDINLEDEIGACISFPRDATLEDEELKVVTGFSLHHEMPKDVESVSPAILIKTANEIEFSKEVHVRMQHNANLKTAEDCSNMVFLMASITPSQSGPGCKPLYKFEVIEGSEAKFNPGEKTGVVKRKSLFSWLKIGRKKRDNHSEGMYIHS